MLRFVVCGLEIDKMDGWIKTAQFSVGGFLWTGFSKKQTNKLICISSEYISVIDCDTGLVEVCDGDYDEDMYIAMCDYLPGEVIDIYGQYGGNPIHITSKEERVTIHTKEDTYGNKMVIRYKIYFSTSDSNIEIFDNYGYYICSFSPCGNYFVLARDAGVTVWKRK